MNPAPPPPDHDDESLAPPIGRVGGLRRRLNEVLETVKPSARVLDGEVLLTDAKNRALLGDFGSPSFRVGFDRLVDALDTEADLHAVGRATWRRTITDLLVSRLRIRDFEKKHPHVHHEAVVAPIIVVGLPHTGTTLLGRLLDHDPVNRSPLVWEVEDLCPPPELDGYWEDPRIATAARRAAREPSPLAVAAPGKANATVPAECDSLLAPSFATVRFALAAHVPSYLDWWRNADLAGAYESHRLQLQVLQSTFPTERWALHGVSHLWHLPVLLETYPDARLVWLHRDPAAAVVALARSTAARARLHTDEPHPDDVGTMWSEEIARVLASAATRLTDRDHVFHLPHLELVDDPVGAVERMYRFFGLGLSDLARHRMEAWLYTRVDAVAPFERLTGGAGGVDVAAVRDRTARYSRDFEVPTEPL